MVERDAYTQLLKNPFNRKAFGSKVDDPYSEFTNTYRIQANMQVTTTSGINSAAYVFKPNPFTTFADLQYMSGGTSTTSAAGWAAYSANPSVYTSGADITSVMASYRVVSWGLKIRLETPQQHVTGNMIIVQVPRKSKDPGATLLANTQLAWSNAYPNIININGPTSISSYLLEMPGAQQIALMDLIGREITIVPKINSYDGFSFTTTSTTNSFNSGERFADTVLVNPSGGVDFIARDDNVMGWNDIHLFFFGLPHPQPIVNIEYILHLEGEPKLASTTANSCVPSLPPKVGNVFRGFDNILRTVNNNAQILTETINTVFNSPIAATMGHFGRASRLRLT